MWCTKCHQGYEIREGIPILVDLQHLPSHLQKQVEYFEEEDASRPHFELAPWQKRYVANFLKYSQPKIGSLIVDNATGSGYMAVELARRGFKVIAIDLTLKELLKLKQVLQQFNLTKNVSLICASSEDLPLKSGIADGLVANAILEHLPREAQAIKEIGRVVKKDAPVMIAVPLAYRYLWPFLWPVNWWHDRRIGHLRRYSRREILAKFKGYHEVYTYYTGHLLKILCLGLYLLTRQNFWNKLGEWFDEKLESQRYGASNVVTVLKKL